MANLITPPIVLPPQHLELEIDFYDSSERTAFSKTSVWPLLSSLPARLAVSTADLCAYYLYYKRRPNVNGFHSHADIAAKWHQALYEFDGMIEFANSSLKLTQTPQTNYAFSERIGEAIGLSVASAIHKLHQGDWVRIPQTSAHQTLDFSQLWLASNGTQLLEVETKGSATDDNTLKSPSISKHKTSIQSKKRSQSQSPQAPAIRYGTIAVLDDRPSTTARCWLVDPPGEQSVDPHAFKIRARLAYIADLLSYVGPRSALAAVLHTRLASLYALKDVAPLNRIPLMASSGKPLDEADIGSPSQRQRWLAGKSTVVGDTVGGQVVNIDHTRMLFIGVRTELISIAVQQDHDRVSTYKFHAGSASKTVECVFPKARFKRDLAFLDIPPAAFNASSTYIWFRLYGHLHYCESGLVFGVLPIPAEWAQQRSRATIRA